jgi:hypothetical protein
VYIGSTALMAMLQTQMTKALPTEPQNQLVFYTGKLTEKLDIDEAAKHLSNYLKSCVEEMKLVCYALAKTDLTQLDREDLVSVDRNLAEVLGIDYAGFSPYAQPNKQSNQQTPWIPQVNGEETNQVNMTH